MGACLDAQSPGFDPHCVAYTRWSITLVFPALRRQRCKDQKFKDSEFKAHLGYMGHYLKTTTTKSEDKKK